MKITPTSTDPLAGKEVAAAKMQPARTSQRTSSFSGTPPSQTEVTLSPQANLLARAEQLMANVPEIDWQRVEELRQAIQNGQFRIHPEKIAERLISEVEHLLSETQ